MTYNSIEFENPWIGLWVVLLAWAIPTVLLVFRDAMVAKSQAWRRTNAVVWLTGAVAAVLSTVISLTWIGFLIPESVTPAVAPQLVRDAGLGVDKEAGEELRVGGDVSEPIEISRVKPACPRNASAGVAVLEAIITADGRVESVRVLRSHSPEGDAAAVAAVRQWRYKPAMYHGKPVAVYLTITVLLCA